MWHAITVHDVLVRLDSNVQSGLSATEIQRRLETFGRNKLPEGRKQGPFLRLLMQFNNILVYVLLAAGFVKLMVGLWLDAAIILGVVVINGLLGFLQEGEAEKALDLIRTRRRRRREPCAAARRAWSRRRSWCRGTSCSLSSAIGSRPIFV